MSAGRRIAGNFSALMAAQGLSMAAGLVSTVWLARHLGPESFGLIGFGAALLTYFGLAASLGTDTLAARRIARADGAHADIAGRVLGLRLALSAIAYAAFAAAVVVVAEDAEARVVMWVQGGGLFATAITLDFLFQGTERMVVNAWRQVGQAGIILVGAVVLVAGPGDVTLAAALTPTGGLVAALVVLAWARREHVGLRPVFAAGEWPRLIAAAAPFALSNLMNTVLFTFDVVMIGLMLGQAAVGAYSAALKLALVATIPAGMLSTAWFPALARRFGDATAMQGEGDRFAGFVLALGVPAAVIGGVFAAPAVQGLYGQAYAEAGPILAVLMGAVGAMHLRMAVGAALPAWNRERWHAGASVAGGLLNIGLNLALIPVWGGLGAAAASLVSHLAIALAFAVAYRSTAEALPIRAVARAVVAGAVLLPIAWGVREGLSGHLGPLPLAVAGVVVCAIVFLVVARLVGLVPAVSACRSS